MRLALVLTATGLAASVAVAAIVAPDAPVATTAAATALPAADAEPGARLPVPTTATVTADLLGEDSVIAVVGHGDIESADARSLEVITPDGVRHPVYSVELGESSSGLPSRGDFTLADWRPETQTALLNVSRGRAGSTAVAYDVVTGATREIALPKWAISVGLDPDGTGVLMTTYADRGAASIWTLSWDGVESPLPGSSGGSPMTSVDGRTLVTGAAHSRRWWVIDLAARTAVALQPPGSCSIIRWLDADSVLTSCYRRGVNQLRSVDLDGASTVLGVRHRVRGRGIFLDGDVREVQGHRWFASHDDCREALTERLASGRVKTVEVPGLAASMSIVGVRGDNLLITHYWPELTAGDCGTPRVREALALFNPVTRSETVLTRLGRDESWTTTLAAAEVRAWSP